MKIDPFFYENNLKNNLENINIIFLHGTNIGLVEVLYKKTLEFLKIDTNNPFSVSKIDGNEFKDNPTVLNDNINTLSVFSEKRSILLDLMHISVNKSIENIILESVKTKNENYLLLIKATNLKVNSFVKHFQNLKNALHVNATTGSTGAGISLIPTSHFSWRNNNFSWYKPFKHQHIKEIYQSVNQLGSNPKINFLPNRGNFTRGIFSTCYTEYNGSLNDVKKIYKSFYKEHPFTLMSEIEISLKSVINSNYCFLHLYKHENILLITSILDNLIKGAAGQAIQNTNIIMGWEEDAGLQLKASTF